VEGTAEPTEAAATVELMPKQLQAKRDIVALPRPCRAFPVRVCGIRRRTNPMRLEGGDGGSILRAISLNFLGCDYATFLDLRQLLAPLELPPADEQVVLFAGY
jgi:hypothetical protein